jgi:hypothetical protein
MKGIIMKTLKKTEEILMKTMLLLITLFIIGPLFSQGGSARVNLGLYGGATDDLTYMSHGSLTRVFAAVGAPASLFYSDNDGNTWLRAFPDDSLESTLAGGTYGWGGGGRTVLTNSNGWVGVLTQQHGGNLSSAVLSKMNGSYNTFFTVLDNFYLKYDHPTTGPSSVTAIALNDYRFFVAMQNYLYYYNGFKRIQIADISTVTGMPTGAGILSIAVSNSITGYPLYIVVSSTSGYGDLFKYDGTSFTAILLPGSLKVEKVFTHPGETTGNKVVISCIEPATGNKYVYVSTNGGGTWANRTPSFMGQFAVSDVEYSSSWVSSMPTSNGMRIVLPGSGFSDDLGATWNQMNLVNNSFTTDPSNPLKIMGTMGYGPVLSTNGATGPFNLLSNTGLEAVKTSKIAKYSISATNAVYYLSTNSGLAYTDAYYNNSVPYPAKWISPHGDFPIANAGDDAGVSSVAIDPNNPLHVVAGYSNGFSITTTGPTGFSNVILQMLRSPQMVEKH